MTDSTMRPVLTLTPIELLRIAEGNPMVAAFADGTEVLVRLPTVDEVIAQQNRALNALPAGGPPPMDRVEAARLVAPVATVELPRPRCFFGTVEVCDTACGGPVDQWLVYRTAATATTFPGYGLVVDREPVCRGHADAALAHARVRHTGTVTLEPLNVSVYMS
jgi:hypothetical protein